MNTRTFIPGSEWLYFKFFTGAKSADKLLADILLPFTNILLDNQVIEEWFYIRYSDPKFHIRFRIKISNSGNFDSVLRLFYQSLNPWVENGLITNIQLDCYSRELERYGINTIIPSEALFFADSVAITKIIARLREKEDSDETRWLLAINLVNDTLEAAGYSLLKKGIFINQVDNGFREEFGIKSFLYKKPLDIKYREKRKKITETFANGGETAKFNDILSERKEQITKVLNKVRISSDKSIDELLPSYTHMTINRLFRSNNRLCEMVIYYLMNKELTSQIALEKHKTK